MFCKSELTISESERDAGDPETKSDLQPPSSTRKSGTPFPIDIGKMQSQAKLVRQDVFLLETPVNHAGSWSEVQ